MKKTLVLLTTVLITTVTTFASVSGPKIEENPILCEDYAFNAADFWFIITRNGFVSGAAFEHAYEECMAMFQS
ncbi:hypothetical protein [Ascidiimonas aurantiaca]|uniref:hypothetical protein n=1 Tax=Ascidiimonas aurantiaca TaxID=1685432 RepID=UPI0030EBE181